MTKDKALKLALETLENIYHANTLIVVQYSTIKAIRKALAAPVQDGWILVPVTLTNDMTSAMADALENPNNERSSWDLAENMWRAMLTVSPTPPAAQPAIIQNYLEKDNSQLAQTLVGKWTGKEIEWTENPYKFKQGQNVYTTPPAAQRTWVGLTDEQRRVCVQSPFTEENYRAIEVKLKENNT